MRVYIYVDIPGVSGQFVIRNKERERERERRGEPVALSKHARPDDELFIHAPRDNLFPRYSLVFFFGARETARVICLPVIYTARIERERAFFLASSAE